MAKKNIKVKDDIRQIEENSGAIQGNVFDNNIKDPANVNNPNLEMIVEPGSLTSAVAGNVADANGVIQGKYGQLTLNSDGTYTYQLTKDMNYLGAGVDLHDEIFTFTTEYHKPDGTDATKEEHLKIDIHGTNDQPLITDVTVSAYEYGTNNPTAGTTGTHNVLGRLNPDVDFEGQFVLGDVDPATPGVQTDVDAGDTHAFKIDTTSINVTSANLTADQIAAIKATVGVNLNAAAEGSPDFGKYTVEGNFDALSDGDTATVTFDYYVEDTSANNDVTASEKKTVTMTVLGTDDDFEANDDTIRSYDDFLDGDIFKTILSNDGHPAGVDVNDTLNVIGTGYRDMDFYNGGGEISVDNAARVLQYEPGGSDDNAIEAGHFKFEYHVSDGHNIHDAEVEFDMYGLGDNGLNDAPNANDTDHAKIDFYTIGDNASERISGVHNKNNVVAGMGGNDHIHGQEKHDILYGGDGDDKLEGRWGNDLYVGGKGTDVLEDKRGHDVYVFSKGDGMDTIEDQDLEIYTDAMGHEDINITNFANAVELAKNVGVITTVDDNAINGLEDYVDVDTVKFDSTVAKTDIAIFQKDDGTLQIKYSDTDMVSVMWQNEDHYGIEKIEASDGTFLSPADIDNIINAIATTDIDASTAGIQTAQNIDDVRNSAALMAVISSAF